MPWVNVKAESRHLIFTIILKNTFFPRRESILGKQMRKLSHKQKSPGPKKISVSDGYDTATRRGEVTLTATVAGGVRRPSLKNQYMDDIWDRSGQ